MSKLAKAQEAKAKQKSKDAKAPAANPVTEAMVTLKRADGNTYSVVLKDMGVKGKKGQYNLFSAQPGNPDISNWGGLFIHAARKS